jgi:CHASE2 domain-containing sensor protein
MALAQQGCMKTQHKLTTVFLGLLILVVIFLLRWRYPTPFDVVELKIMDLLMYRQSPTKPLDTVVIVTLPFAFHATEANVR